MKTNDINKAAPSVDVPRLVRYSADVQEDATGQFYIHPVTGLRVDKPSDGWPKGHHVTFTPIKVKLAQKIDLGLSNRDGEIMIGKGVDGRCYLIAEADTYRNADVFEGLGSTEHIEITAEAFLSLAND